MNYKSKYLKYKNKYLSLKNMINTLHGGTIDKIEINDLGNAYSDIDYKSLLKWTSEQGRLVRSFYYTALIEDQEYSPIKPLVDWLDYNGYSMVTKPTREYIDDEGRRKIKGNMDIELCVDMMEISDKVDHIMLFSGDGDFRRRDRSEGRDGGRGGDGVSLRAKCKAEGGPVVVNNMPR